MTPPVFVFCSPTSAIGLGTTNRLLTVGRNGAKDVPEPRLATNRIEARIAERSGERPIVPRPQERRQRTPRILGRDVGKRELTSLLR